MYTSSLSPRPCSVCSTGSHTVDAWSRNETSTVWEWDYCMCVLPSVSVSNSKFKLYTMYVHVSLTFSRVLVMWVPLCLSCRLTNSTPPGFRILSLDRVAKLCNKKKLYFTDICMMNVHDSCTPLSVAHFCQLNTWTHMYRLETCNLSCYQTPYQNRRRSLVHLHSQQFAV